MNGESPRPGKWEVVAEAYVLNGVPAAKAGLRYTRQLDRGTRFVRQVAKAAHISRDELGKRIEENERADDLIHRAGQEAVLTSDERYQTTLATLIGTAMADAARFDEKDLLVNWVLELTPAHLRVLVQMPSICKAAWSKPVERNECDLVVADIEQIAGSLHLDEEMTVVLLEGLASKGLIREVFQEGLNYSDQPARSGRWELRPLGYDVVAAGGFDWSRFVEGSAI